MRFFYFVGTWVVALVAIAKADLIVERKEEPNGMRYELIMRQATETQVIWETLISNSTASPLGGPKIAEWCNLVAADQTKDGILVLIERNEFTIELLQFDGGGRLLFDLQTADPGWLKALRHGQRVTVSAPDQVHVRDSNGESQTFIFSGGRITDESGRLPENNLIALNGKVRREVKRPNSEEIRSGVLAKDAKASTGGSKSSREGERASLWLAMTALIAGIGGFLWFFYRKQRSQ